MTGYIHLGNYTISRGRHELELLFQMPLKSLVRLLLVLILLRTGDYTNRSVRNDFKLFQLSLFLKHQFNIPPFTLNCVPPRLGSECSAGPIILSIGFMPKTRRRR